MTSTPVFDRKKNVLQEQVIVDMDELHRLTQDVDSIGCEGTESSFNVIVSPITQPTRRFKNRFCCYGFLAMLGTLCFLMAFVIQSLDAAGSYPLRKEQDVIPEFRCKAGNSGVITMKSSKDWFSHQWDYCIIQPDNAEKQVQMWKKWRGSPTDYFEKPLSRFDKNYIYANGDNHVMESGHDLQVLGKNAKLLKGLYETGQPVRLGELHTEEKLTYLELLEVAFLQISKTGISLKAILGQWDGLQVESIKKAKTYTDKRNVSYIILKKDQKKHRVVLCGDNSCQQYLDREDTNLFFTELKAAQKKAQTKTKRKKSTSGTGPPKTPKPPKPPRNKNQKSKKPKKPPRNKNQKTST